MKEELGEVSDKVFIGKGKGSFSRCESDGHLGAFRRQELLQQVLLVTEELVDCPLGDGELFGPHVPPLLHQGGASGREPADFARRLGRVQDIPSAEDEQRVRDPRPHVLPGDGKHEIRPRRAEHIAMEPVHGALRRPAPARHFSSPRAEPVIVLAPRVRPVPPLRFRRVDVDPDRLQEHGPAEPIGEVPQQPQRVARSDARAQ
eukprot:CAMPEP_0172529784 /NCGR_PEP_ID=MMETSP1067-20121228/3776_1 /TAXON_ID=265564 ORGANISM="Thalassiosira punctigera, Strain Tpunct2005C2" /NCGR_SAMPLE_ID=MMETSP1067 /ASSEMBLY_ACC=CAM_ASM_000444 /LENGTH=202 /DNA_ID=CAMNT_0013313907 /DNA_START=163 /DNA_END=773 /DNA_ORIENTATION=-